MRQGNGSDLLGLKDPRSTKIGIIYVAPNDDRKSVLAAILTQEKLGRKQISDYSAREPAKTRHFNGHRTLMISMPSGVSCVPN